MKPNLKRYTWYLQPAFNDRFQRCHWWKPETEVEPVAALYELARRHPSVGELMSILERNPKFDFSGAPSSLVCLARVGLKTWTNLDGRNQEFWEQSAGRLKGLECRYELERCDSVTLSALTEVLIRRVSSLKRKGKGLSHEEFTNFVAKSWHQNPPTVEEIETEVMHAALMAHRQGQHLIAVAQDLTDDDARTLLSKTYRKHRVLGPKFKQRSRPENWLPLISNFESAFLLGRKQSQVFARYRRALNRIQFASEAESESPTRCRHILAAREFFARKQLEAISATNVTIARQTKNTPSNS